MNAGDEPIPKLKVVGYWRSFYEWPWDRALPSPCWCVDACWFPHERELIVDYLNSGIVISGSLGYSYCRFRCGIPDEEMGSCDLSDGVWMWPQGLTHYVDKHAVKLPDSFVHTMRAHEWRIPAEFAEKVRIARAQPPPKRCRTGDIAAPLTVDDLFDYGPWREWAKRLRPWYVFW